MHLHDESIGAGGQRGVAERGHEVAAPSRVRRVRDDRQMRLHLEPGDGGQIEGVARLRAEGPDPALAQHDLHVAPAHDVLRREEQVLQRGRHPALEQHRALQLSDLAQQREVLHVPRPDLQHVGVAGHQFRVAGIHDLGDDGKPGLAPDPREDLQALLLEPVEGIGRGPGLERAAPQQRRTRCRGDPARLRHHFGSLDGAGAGRDQALRPSEAVFAHPHHGGRVGREVPCRELVRTHDRMYRVHAGYRQQRDARQAGLVTDAADDRAGLADRDMCTESCAFDALANVVDLVCGNVLSGDNDHGMGSWRRLCGNRWLCGNK